MRRQTRDNIWLAGQSMFDLRNRLTADRDESSPFYQSLEPIHDLNRRMLGLFAEEREEIGHPDFDRETPVGAVLSSIDPSVQQQLARCPFLLLDASFEDASKWRSHDVLCERASDAALPRAPHTRVLALARSTCLLAWYLVRTNPVAARLVLGVSRECAQLIAQSDLTELQEIAARLVQHGAFKPRWRDRPEVWRRLIALAHTTRRSHVGVHGLQLFLGDLLDEEAKEAK